MKIAISGAHSQGKTTLVKHLQDKNLLPGFNFKTSLTRGLQEAGFIINESGDEITQLAVMTKHFQYLSEEGNIVYDRCALDGYAYTMALPVRLEILDIIRQLFALMINSYDIIFYVVPELELQEDGQRTVNKEFFRTVVQSFQSIINQYKLPVVLLSGTVENRIKTILKTINDFKKQPYEL